jgi:hypothetical protein
MAQRTPVAGRAAVVDASVRTYSLYWSNVPAAVTGAQRRVFERLGRPLDQQQLDRQPHGEWMNLVMQRAAPDEIVVFCDIDAFPLSAAAFDRAVESARRGAVFGLAQYANQKSNEALYAGPMFLAVARRTWERLGSPDLARNRQFDAGENLSHEARRQGVELELVMPCATLVPRWALADRGVFGIGTFYGDCEYFHLFESRRRTGAEIMRAVTDDVAAGRPLDFQRYLEVTRRSERSLAARAERFYDAIRSLERNWRRRRKARAAGR